MAKTNCKKRLQGGFSATFRMGLARFRGRSVITVPLNQPAAIPRFHRFLNLSIALVVVFVCSSCSVAGTPLST